MPIDYWSDYLLDEEDRRIKREEFYEEYGYYPEDEEVEPDDFDDGDFVEPDPGYLPTAWWKYPEP